MQIVKLAALTTLAMIAFAANPIFCRKALKDTGIDVASFTSIRLGLAQWRFRRSRFSFVGIKQEAATGCRVGLG